jgi:hypothetical protein
VTRSDGDKERRRQGATATRSDGNEQRRQRAATATSSDGDEWQVGSKRKRRNSPAHAGSTAATAWSRDMVERFRRVSPFGLFPSWCALT